MMNTRRLGNSELDLTVVGLGTWAIGGPWQFGWGPQDDNDSADAIREALDCGINWIDTAPIYGCSHSEEVIGRVLKGCSARPIIATKFGLIWNEKLEKINCLDHNNIIAECEASLKRLGVDVIDLYQMHWPIPDEQIEQAWEAVARLAEQGKIRYAGLCNASVDQISRAQNIFPVTSLQPPYNILRRDIETELIGYCGQNNIGVVAYSTMAKGLLTGKFDKEKVSLLPPGDVRTKDANFAEPALSKNLKLIEALKSIAAASGRTAAQLAIAWVLRKSEVTSAIVGARKAGQIAETAKAADYVLSDDEIAEIESLIQS